MWLAPSKSSRASRTLASTIQVVKVPVESPRPAHQHNLRDPPLTTPRTIAPPSGGLAMQAISSGRALLVWRLHREECSLEVLAGAHPL